MKKNISFDQIKSQGQTVSVNGGNCSSNVLAKAKVYHDNSLGSGEGFHYTFQFLTADINQSGPKPRPTQFC